MSIVREEPPAAKGGSGQMKDLHLETAAALKADPNEWYKIATGLRYPQMAHHIKRGTLVAFKPAGSFEAKARKADGLWSIYARYVGEV